MKSLWQCNLLCLALVILAQVLSNLIVEDVKLTAELQKPSVSLKDIYIFLEIWRGVWGPTFNWRPLDFVFCSPFGHPSCVTQSTNLVRLPDWRDHVIIWMFAPQNMFVNSELLTCYNVSSPKKFSKNAIILENLQKWSQNQLCFLS